MRLLDRCRGTCISISVLQPQLTSDYYRHLQVETFLSGHVLPWRPRVSASRSGCSDRRSQCRRRNERQQAPLLAVSPTPRKDHNQTSAARGKRTSHSLGPGAGLRAAWSHSLEALRMKCSLTAEPVCISVLASRPALHHFLRQESSANALFS